MHVHDYMCMGWFFALFQITVSSQYETEDKIRDKNGNHHITFSMLRKITLEQFVALFPSVLIGTAKQK